MDISINEIYNNLLTVKKNKNVSKYPYNIVNKDNAILTKKQIELFYSDDYKKKITN